MINGGLFTPVLYHLPQFVKRSALSSSAFLNDPSGNLNKNQLMIPLKATYIPASSGGTAFGGRGYGLEYRDLFAPPRTLNHLPIP